MFRHGNEAGDNELPSTIKMTSRSGIRTPDRFGDTLNSTDYFGVLIILPFTIKRSFISKFHTACNMDYDLIIGALSCNTTVSGTQALGQRYGELRCNKRESHIAAWRSCGSKTIANHSGLGLSAFVGFAGRQMLHYRHAHLFVNCIEAGPRVQCEDLKFKIIG